MNAAGPLAAGAVADGSRAAWRGPPPLLGPAAVGALARGRS